MEQLWLHLALAGAGIAAGFLNTMAGGGSLLTLPVLMLLGLPADVANGTNRLSVMSQSMSGLIGFQRHGMLERSAILPVVVPTLVGATVGALTAAHVPALVLKYVLLATMMFMAVLMAVFPGTVIAPRSAEPAAGARRWVAWLGLLGAGLYGGFIQAGVGVLLLGVLGGLLRYDLVRANALKLLSIAIFSMVALGVFIMAGQVSWLVGALLALYTTLGAQLGVRFALRVDQRVLRWIVVVSVTAMCIAALVKG